MRTFRLWAAAATVAGVWSTQAFAQSEEEPAAPVDAPEAAEETPAPASAEPEPEPAAPAPTEPAPAATPAAAETGSTAPAAPARDFRTYASETGGAEGSETGNADAARGRQLLSTARITAPQQTYPYVEWHGYFRFRADSFWNLDLDTAGTSPVLPPIESLLEPGTGTSFSDSEIPAEGTDENGQSISISQFQDPDAEVLGSANIRMRLRPTFHVTEDARIHLELNILDNLVLGSTPDGFNEARFGSRGVGPDGIRTDMPLLGFTGSQEAPNLFSAGRNSVSVTQAYGEVRTVLGSLRVGRMASQWGLGILANGGGSHSALSEPRESYRGVSLAGHGCLDCDYGDYVDRAMFVTKVPGLGTYLALAWDYNASGPTDVSLYDSFGQSRDITNADDVTSYVVSLFSRPLQPDEIEERNIQLKELRRPTFDWGAYFVIRQQDLSTEKFNAYTELNQYAWIVRNARAYIPDVWFRLQYEPRFGRRLRIEGEFAAVLGSIENANPDTLSNYNPVREREIAQFGGALELEYQTGDLTTGLNGGFATGRSIEEDQINEGDPPPTGFGVIDQFSPNAYEPRLTNFRFDRNYFVDMIMFREIIGTITNAVYANPFVQFDLFTPQDDALGVRLDVIAGLSMDPTTTPSGESFYGVETDVSIYWREPRYGADITAGLFLPGSAFDAVAGRPRIGNIGRLLNRQTYSVDDAPTANAAWTLQGRFFWAF